MLLGVKGASVARQMKEAVVRAVVNGEKQIEAVERLLAEMANAQRRRAFWIDRVEKKNRQKRVLARCQPFVQLLKSFYYPEK